MRATSRHHPSCSKYSPPPTPRVAICRPCDRTFVNPQALLAHVQNSSFHAFDCLQCELHYENSEELKEHLSYRCSVCSAHHQDSEDRDDHEENNHFWCNEDDCEEGFKSESEVLQHYSEAHNCCTRCESYHGSKEELVQHINDIHPPNLLVPCLCGLAFPFHSTLFHHLEFNSCTALTSHLFYHILLLLDLTTAITSMSGPLFTDTAATLDGWVDYALNSRNEDEEYECKCCGWTFRFQADFLGHFYYRSLFDRPGGGIWKCSNRICKRGFNAPSELLAHREKGECLYTTG